MPRTVFSCLAVLIPFLALGDLPARETGLAGPSWPQFRGPNRDGVSEETGLLKQWPDNGPKLVWKSQGLGRGYSSVAIADGRIYTMGDLPANGRQRDACIIALDLATGKELWTAKMGRAFFNGQGDGPRCTPCVDGGLVFGTSANGDLACVDARSGKVIWRKSFAADFGGRMQRGWGYSESPLVDGDRLICTPGGPDATLVALNKKTGAVIWKARTPEADRAAYCSIILSNAGGVKQYVQTVEGGVIGVRASDGKFLWRYNRIANTTANIPSSIARGDYLFCTTGYNAGAALLKLSADGAGGIKAEEVYFLSGRELQNHHGGMVLIGDHLYGGHGHNQGFPVCVDFMSGKVLWRERGPGSGSAAVVFADGHLYFRYQSGHLALIEASPEGYKLKGTFKLPESDRPSWPHPVVAGGRLYLREQDALYCYDVKTP